MIFSIEMKCVHDLVLLDTLIDAWKAKWNADDEELKHGNAEVESEDRDDVSETDDEELDAKATAEALAKLAKACRDNGIDNVSFTYRDSTGDHLKK